MAPHNQYHRVIRRFLSATYGGRHIEKYQAQQEKPVVSLIKRLLKEPGTLVVALRRYVFQYSLPILAEY